MPLFISLVLKIFPLYINILLGYIAGKKLEANRDTIARIMFFMINPIVIFNGVILTDINASILTLPFFTFLIASSICLIFYHFSKKIWSDTSKNIMAFSAGSGNTGYFGLTLAILLFEDQIEGVYIMAMLGVTLYESTIGYYISAKGNHTPYECLIKLIKLPSLYALLLGLFINYLQFPIPEMFKEFIIHIKGVYTVLGMMIIGLGLSTMKSFKLDMKFIGMTFLAKFFVWPLVSFLFILFDVHYLGLYTPDVHQALILLSIVPLAVNTVVIASLMQAHPEKAAATVLISTLFALLYVPLMTSLLLSL